MRATLAAVARRCQLFLLALLLLPLPAPAQPGSEAVRKVVQRFAEQQLTGQPGRFTIEVGAVEAGLRLPPCQHIEAFLPPGARLWGTTSVGVRCAAGAGWTVYVPVTVRVEAPVVVAARPLSAGRVLTAEDVTLQNQDLTQLPAGVLTETAQAVGQTLNVGLMPGYALRQDMLRPPLVVRQGQTVKLIARGGGFTVSAEGRALGNAAAGQTVQVRTASGQTVSGVARPDGTVEVSF